MAKINYNLSTKIDKNGENEILLDIIPARGMHYRLKSGVRTSPENYAMLMRADRITSLGYLMELEKKLYEAMPCPKDEAIHILDMVSHADNILAMYDSFIRSRAIEKGLTDGTMQLYRSARVILKEVVGDGQMSIKGINTDFLNDYISKMTDKGLSNVTQTNYFRVIKVFLGHLEKQGLIDHKIMLYKPKFRTGVNDVIYLTHNELYRMMGLDLKGHDKVVRDMFCIQCMTGMRYSDISNIRKENIREDANGRYISILTRKTQQRLQIYLNTTVCDILKDYDWTLPDYTIDRMNNRIQKIAKKAGITGDVEVVSFIGNKRVVEHKQKWEMVRSHTARRTFICQCLEKGISTPIIQSITGHRQLSSFQKYVGVGSKTKSDVVAKLEI